MNKRRLQGSLKLTLGAMVTTLTVLLLYAAAVLPAARLVFYFLASFLPFILVCEGLYGWALTAFLAGGILSFFLLPDKVPVYMYFLLLGHYVIFRTALQERMQSRLFRLLVKLLYVDLFAGLGLYLSLAVFDITLVQFPSLPDWVIAVLSQVAILVWDALLGACVKIYEARFRRAIIPRR